MDTMFGSFQLILIEIKFQQHFSENAVNNGCMQYLIAYLPLLKEFFNLGGFGAKAYQQRKFTSALAILSSLVSGAIIGQALIPIPLVGCIVGGIIGGYLENKGMTNYTKSRNLKKLYGHWECNKINLDILVINFKILNDYIPKVLSEDSERQTKWINLVIFTILSLFFNLNDIVKVWQECLDCLLKIYIN